MTEALPNAPQTPYAQVQWRVASIHADGADADSYPDWIPAVGERVILTPSLKEPLIVYDVAGPEPWTVTVSPVEGVINETGLLTKPDGRPVLIAASDDPLMSHRGWTWTATFKGHKITFSAPAGETVDLSNFVALPATEQVESWVGEIPTLITSSEALRTAVETAGTGIESITKIGPNTIQFMLVGGITHDVTLEGIPGKSAYQLAVDAGFVGTEVEWLASLKGADSTVPAVDASHEALTIDGDTTLPSEHQVITLRVSSPATLSIADAPDGTVVTAHVAYGWEDITWAPGIVVQGETSTTETWLVLVRSEGQWKVLVSGESGGSPGESGGSSGGGSGILTGNGNPNTLGIKAATVGVLYADEAETDGATLWSADSVDTYDGTTYWAVDKGYAYKYLDTAGAELNLSRFGPMLDVRVNVNLTESGNGEEVTLPTSTIDFGEVEGGFKGEPAAQVLVLITPDDEWLSSAVQLPPIVSVFTTQSGRYVLHIPEVVIPAYTSPDPVMVIGSAVLTAGPWPVGSGGSGGI